MVFHVYVAHGVISLLLFRWECSSIWEWLCSGDCCWRKWYWGRSS